ncbi:MAG: Bor/Iss family lipoprotein [Myxococcota bacterium]
MRPTVLTLALALATALLATGCYRHQYVNTSVRSSSQAQSYQWHHHLLWGLVNVAPEVPLDRICPRGVARIENWMGPVQALLSFITAGIYTPTTVRVFCAAGGGPVDVGVRLDGEAMGELEERYPDLQERAERAESDLRDQTDQALRPPE